MEGYGHLDLQVFPLDGRGHILEAAGTAIAKDPGAAAAGTGSPAAQASEKPAEDVVGDADIKNITEVEPPEDVLLGEPFLAWEPN